MKPRHRFYIVVVSVSQLAPGHIRDLIYAALAGKAVERPIALKRARSVAARGLGQAGLAATSTLSRVAASGVAGRVWSLRQAATR